MKREELMYKIMQEGATYKQIGEKFKVCASRARALVLKHEHDKSKKHETIHKK